jgi:hypothetical protein
MENPMASRKTPAPAEPKASTEATTPAAPAGDAAPLASPDAPPAAPPAADPAEAAKDAPAEPKAKAPKLPKKIKLTCPFGFMGDDDQPRMWAAGQIIEDPEEIKLLVGLHKVEHEHLE